MKDKELAKSKRDRILMVFIFIFAFICVGLVIYIGVRKYEQNKVTTDEAHAKYGGYESANDTSYLKKVEEYSNKYAQTADNKEHFDKLVELCKTNTKALPILENFSDYPPRVIKMIALNEETLDFVLGYPEKVDKKVDENIDISGDVTEGVIPHFLQWDQRWGYYSYGNGVIGYTACGPTCLSMVYTYLTGDLTYNPLKMTKFSIDNDYIEKGVGTKWLIMTEGANQLNISSKTLKVNEEAMAQELEIKHPIICSVGPGDFTDTGHFIVLTDYDQQGFSVNDPNSKKNSAKKWSFDQIKGQIKGLWSFWK